MDTEIVFPPDSVRVRIPRGWIRPETFRLFLADTLLTRGVDYLLDARRGTLRMLRPIPAGERLHATYLAFPLPLLPEHRRHLPFVPSAETGTEPSGPAPVPGAAGGSLTDRWRQGVESATRLQIAGSKTFSVEVGSQKDLALKQSLDLSVNGRIGREVKVRAILTDRNTPLQPEGTSTTLQDLDRVLLEVEGPGARMTVGDYFLSLPPSEFAHYSRQLEGVRGEVTPAGGSIFAAGATSPGTFASVQLIGEEGKQGPYKIRPPGTTREGGIVAGSETVWLEGRRLVRGENEDYIIDYAEGTITFTGRWAITAYSRIAVDFQFSSESYPRSVYSAGFTWGDATLLGETEPAAAAAETGTPSEKGKPAIRVSWLTERDDRNAPIGLPLTEAEKAALRRAGDAPSAELASGIHFVGAGNGDYEKVFTDTLATGFFVYVGADSGSYLVSFQDVGNGSGDYADTTSAAGSSFFRFVGRKAGRYLPGREVPRPESATILSVAAAARPGLGLELHAETALSSFDANTFSSKDDGNNQGMAFLLRGQSDPLQIGPARIRLGTHWREIDSRFHPLDRLDPSFFGLDWNVDPQRLSEGDRRVGADASVEAGAERVGFTLETLDNTKDFRASRGILTLAARPGPVELSGRVLRTNSRDDAGETTIDGRRATEDFSAIWNGRWLATRAHYAGEWNSQGENENRTGTFFREGGLRVGTGSRWRQLQLSLDLTRRRTWSLAGTREIVLDVGDTGIAQAGWTMADGRYLSVEYSRRQLRPEDGRPERTSQLGRVRWLQRIGGGLFQQEGRWELSTSEEAAKSQEIQFVGEGAGHYDSLGVYQGIGDYEVLTRELPEGLLVNRIDASFRSEVDLSRARTGSHSREPRLLERAWRSLRLVHYWTARVESDHPASYLWARMLPILAGDRDLSSVEVQMRADLTALSSARWFSPRLRWEHQVSETGYVGSLHESTTSSLYAVRLRSRPLSIWSADLEQEWEIDAREVDAGAGGGRSGWNSFRSLMDHQLSVRRGVSLSFEGSYRRRDRIRSPETAVVYELTPAVVWSPQSRSRVELKTTRTAVERRNGTGRASLDLERPGWNTRLVASLRLRDALDLSVWLRESQPDHGRRVQEARTELRATF